MKVDFSKDFTKALDKLTGKVHHSIVDAINNVMQICTILAFATSVHRDSGFFLNNGIIQTDIIQICFDLVQFTVDNPL